MMCCTESSVVCRSVVVGVKVFRCLALKVQVCPLVCIDSGSCNGAMCCVVEGWWCNVSFLEGIL